MSLGNIVERDAPAIWRGPIIMKVIQQFLRDVDWGELDYFLVDLPPGTGDAQLSLVQTVRLHGAAIVTTPQEVAVGDSLRGAKMFERVNVSVLGVVENMSYFVCPHCGDRSEIFLAGGGQRLADELGVPLLGQAPLQAGMADLADEGRPIVLAAKASPAARALDAIARRGRRPGRARARAAARRLEAQRAPLARLRIVRAQHDPHRVGLEVDVPTLDARPHERLVVVHRQR
jgi:ATP-binding protein involved in chromosome partitioning